MAITLDDVQSLTLEAIRAQMPDAVFGGLVVIEEMLNTGKIMFGGGKHIEMPLRLKAAKNHGAFAGWDTLSTDPDNTSAYSEWPWREHYTTWSYNYGQINKNRGMQQIVSLIQEKIDVAMQTASTDMENYFFGGGADIYTNASQWYDGVVAYNADGTTSVTYDIDDYNPSDTADAANVAKGGARYEARPASLTTAAEKTTAFDAFKARSWNGIQNILGTSGSPGGLDSSDASHGAQWQSRFETLASSDTLTRTKIDKMYRQLTRGGKEWPQIGVADIDSYNTLQDIIWAKRRFNSNSGNDFDVDGMWMNRMKIRWTDNQLIKRHPNDQFTLKMLNLNYLFIVCHENEWMMKVGPILAPSSPGEHYQMFSMGNVVCNNRRFLGEIRQVA